jgi:serine phosphatase RsbU (regulator of sigma subunit)
MMISGILGIIDEEESMLYYFNAEHPFAILYRNNQASFLDEEITVRKFGFPSDLPFKVQKFYLERK